MKSYAAVLVALAFTGVLLSGSQAEEVTVVASGHGAQSPKQPQIAIGAKGAVHVVFGVGAAVHYAMSSDNGTTFGKPQVAFPVPNLSLGMRRGPRISSTRNAIVVTAIGGVMGRGRDGDLLAWRSVDNGTTWLGPVRVNDTADSAREGLHAMASGPDGSVWCVWLDLRDRKTEIYAARSVDSGATWEPNLCVYRSPDGSVCECCHPSVIVAKDRLHVMFRNALAGNRDMYLTSSADNGQSFAPAVRLGQGTWPLDACPMDGGMLAATAAGGIETAWRRDDKIFAALGSGQPEVLLGRGQQPWIAATKAGSFIVWTTGRDGDLMLNAPGAHKAKKIAQGVRDPMIVSSMPPQSLVICCWESKRGDDVAVVVQRIDNLK